MCPSEQQTASINATTAGRLSTLANHTNTTLRLGAYLLRRAVYTYRVRLRNHYQSILRHIRLTYLRARRCDRCAGFNYKPYVNKEGNAGTLRWAISSENCYKPARFRVRTQHGHAYTSCIGHVCGIPPDHIRSIKEI